MILGIVYTVASFSYNDFIDALEDFLSQITSEDKRMVLMGDFNIDLLNSDGCDDFLNSILSSYLYPLVSIHTRITQSSGTLINNFLLMVDY